METGTIGFHGAVPGFLLGLPVLYPTVSVLYCGDEMDSFLTPAEGTRGVPFGKNIIFFPLLPPTQIFSFFLKKLLL